MCRVQEVGVSTYRSTQGWGQGMYCEVWGQGMYCEVWGLAGRGEHGSRRARGPGDRGGVGQGVCRQRQDCRMKGDAGGERVGC